MRIQKKIQNDKYISKKFEIVIQKSSKDFEFKKEFDNIINKIINL